MYQLRKGPRDPKVIFEDADILVLDKPDGWIVNDAVSAIGQPIIQSWLATNFSYEIATSVPERSGVVHRLDKDTSGILLVAKTKQAFYDLQSQFAHREVSKTYTALLHGALTPPQGEVSVAVGRLPWRRDRFGVIPDGRLSVSGYKLIDLYRPIQQTKQFDALYSLTSFFPKTGRTHQIRIHAKYLGASIVCDPFYAGRKTARRDALWCPRLFLHASQIEFNHPASGIQVRFESELPDDLRIVLKHLEKVNP